MATKKKMSAQAYEHVPLAKLEHDPRNVRVHPDANIEAICESLRQFGQTIPLVVRKDTHVVISGNGRLEAMRRLGWDTAEVRYVDWTEEKARVYALVDNRTSETSEWDFDKLSAEADDLLSSDTFNMEAMGFDDDFMASLHEEPAPLDERPPDLDRPKHGKPVQCTREQREVFDKACGVLRQNHGDDISEGRCLELMAADYMAGA